MKCRIAHLRTSLLRRKGSSIRTLSASRKQSRSTGLPYVPSLQCAIFCGDFLLHFSFQQFPLSLSRSELLLQQHVSDNPLDFSVSQILSCRWFPELNVVGTFQQMKSTYSRVGTSRRHQKSLVFSFSDGSHCCLHPFRKADDFNRRLSLSYKILRTNKRMSMGASPSGKNRKNDQFPNLPQILRQVHRGPWSPA